MRTIILLALAICAAAADWPAFRGVHGDGKAEGTGYALKWSQSENIRWKVPLRKGNGSPIVSKGRLFLLDASVDGRERRLLCLDREDGKQLWTRAVTVAEKQPTHKTNYFGSSTPAANGSTVLAWHSSGGLHAYDFSGELLWSRALGDFRHMWGYATSPVIDGERVVLLAGPGKTIFATALDLKTGKTLWQTDEPVDGDGERNAAGHFMGSWTTPRIVDIGEGRAAICSLPTRVNAYDLNNGKILWTVEGLRGKRGDLAYSSPVIEGELGLAIGGYQGPGVGFNLRGERLWRNERNPQNIGSGVIIDGKCYLAHAGPATIECRDVATGTIRWEAQAPSGEKFWGSVVAADGRLYVTGQSGLTLVFAANPERFELLSRNDLDEGSNSTPAFSDGQIFLRTFSHLYCIAVPQ
jgi:outer membrane protein assembly factor BamB